MGPAAIPILVGTTVLSAGFGAYSALASGAAQARWNKYNAAVSERNAKAAAAEAKANAERKREETRRRLSYQMGKYAASGVDVGQGSPLLVMEDTAAQGELDALLTEYYGRSKQEAYLSEAELARQRASSAKASGYMNAAQSLLGGAADVAGYYAPKPKRVETGAANG